MDRRVRFAILAALFVAAPLFGDTIRDMPDASSVTGTDGFFCDQGSSPAVTRECLASQLATYISASLADDSVTPDNILAAGQTDGYCLTYQASGDTWAWATCGSAAGDMTKAVYDASPEDNVVDTAAALAANGSNCSAGEIPLGVDAAGAVEGCYEPAEADISDLDHTATAITDGLIVAADMADADHGDVAWFSSVASVQGVDADSVALTTDTTGNYVSSATASQGLLLTGTEGASLGFVDCAANEIMKRNAGDTGWECSADSTGGSPTFDAIATGTNTAATMTVGSGAAIELEEGGEVEANEVVIFAQNETGATIYKCSAVHIHDFDVPSVLPEIVVADSDDLTLMPATGIMYETVANGASGRVLLSGMLLGADTSSGTFAVGDRVYVNDSGTSTSVDCGETLTDTKPANTDDSIQAVGTVVRVHGTLGKVVVSGAGRSNDVPVLQDDYFWVGNGSNVATAVQMSGDATMANTGAVSLAGDVITEAEIADDAVEESHLKSVNAATDEYCLTYESTGGDFEWEVCGSGSGDVVGPASATDNAAARFDEATGKLVQDSYLILGDTGDLTTGDGSSGDLTVTADGDAGTDGSYYWDVSADRWYFNEPIVTAPTAAPAMTLTDSDTTDEDISAQFTANATDVGSGTEDIDVTLEQQVAGSMTAFLTADADGSGDDRIVLPNDSIGPDELLAAGQTDEYCLVYEATGDTFAWAACAAASGDVVGPASSTDNAIARFDSTTGKLLQDSSVTVSDTGVLTAGGSGGLIQGPGTSDLDLDANGQSVTIGDASGNEMAVSDAGATTFAGTASLEVPNADAPTTDAQGEIALDNLITDHQPLLQYYDGGENMSVIAIDTAQLPATDNEIIKYDAASDKFVLEADAGAAGGDSVSIDGVEVVNPDFVSSGDIDFVDTSNTVTANYNEDSIAVADVADGDWGDFSVSTNSATLDADVVAAAEMADADHGDISWSSGVASIDANVVDGTHIALGSDAQGDIMYYNGTNYVRLPPGTDGQFLETNGAAANPQWSTASGTGDVSGPASSTDNAIARFDGAGGKTLQNSAITISDAGALTVGGSGSLVQGDGVGDLDIDANGQNITLGDASGNEMAISDAGATTFAGTASLEVPNSDAPTTNAQGEIALDNLITDHQPLLQYYDGGENMTVIAIDTAQLPATDNEIVKYDAGTDKFVLEADAGGGSGAFSDAADPIVQNTTTKDVHVGDGAGTLTGKMEIGGDADQPQLVVEGYSTQTDSIFIVQNDADTELFAVNNDGSVTVSGSGSLIQGDGSGDLDLDANDQNITLGDGGTTNYVQVSNGGVMTFVGGDIDLPADSVDEADLKSVNAATDEYYLTYESTTGDFEWQVGGGTSPKETYWTAAATLPIASASGADGVAPINQDSAGTTTIQVASFDDTDDECRAGTFLVPSDVGTGATAVTFRAKYFAATGSTNSVYWDFYHDNGNDAGDVWDEAFTKESDGGCAPGSATQDTIAECTWSETMTNLGWAASDLVKFEVCRDGDHASDNLSGDAQLLDFAIEMPRTGSVAPGDAYYQFPAGAFEMHGSNQAPLNAVDGTNQDYNVRAFDDTTDECVWFRFTLPGDFDSTGTPVARLNWHITDLSDDTVWYITHIAVADGENIDQAGTTDTSAAFTSSGTADYMNGDTWNLTDTNWSANDEVFGKLCRDPDHASDTASGDAKVVKLSISVPRS